VQRNQTTITEQGGRQGKQGDEEVFCFKPIVSTRLEGGESLPEGKKRERAGKKKPRNNLFLYRSGQEQCGREKDIPRGNIRKSPPSSSRDLRGHEQKTGKGTFIQRGRKGEEDDQREIGKREAVYSITVISEKNVISDQLER